MGAPPTQYPIGQNQNAGAYAAQGWGAAAYQQWPGQPNDPCRFIYFLCFVYLQILLLLLCYIFAAKADPNAAAWAAYYQQQQFYQQPGSGAPSAQTGNPGQPEANSGSVHI